MFLSSLWDPWEVEPLSPRRTPVYTWRCGISVAYVQHLAIISAVFWILCSLFKWVVATMSEDYAIPAYDRMVLINCSHGVFMSSLEWHYVVCVSARRKLKLVLALMCMFRVCCLTVIPLSYVTPRICGNCCSCVGVPGMVISCSVTCGLVLYSLLYGVLGASVVFVAEAFSLFAFSQFS